jgi:cobalt transporter subunit CbtB
MTNLTAIRVPAWAWALMAFAVMAVLFGLQENGAVLGADKAMWLHELTHDARHALGVPCH